MYRGLLSLAILPMNFVLKLPKGRAIMTGKHKTIQRHCNAFKITSLSSSTIQMHLNKAPLKTAYAFLVRKIISAFQQRPPKSRHLSALNSPFTT